MKLMEGVQANAGDAASAAAAHKKVRENILDGGAPEEEELAHSPDSHTGEENVPNSTPMRGGLERRASAWKSALQVGIMHCKSQSTSYRIMKTLTWNL